MTDAPRPAVAGMIKHGHDCDQILTEAREFLEELFSTGQPLRDLHSQGRFPIGWPERYLAWIERVSEAYGPAPKLPPEILAVIYNASVYCTKRFNDWSKQAADTSESDFDAVNDVRWAGDRLILGPYWSASRERE